jgi:hypothetical protein
LYQHLIQNKNQKFLADWQSRYVILLAGFYRLWKWFKALTPVYGNG